MHNRSARHGRKVLGPSPGAVSEIVGREVQTPGMSTYLHVPGFNACIVFDDTVDPVTLIGKIMEIRASKPPVRRFNNADAAVVIDFAAVPPVFVASTEPPAGGTVLVRAAPGALT